MKIIRYLKRVLIFFLTQIYDPLLSLKIGNQSIKAFLSHPLREILLIHKNYNFNLSRIVKYVNDYYPETKVIDIGANIGDSVAFIKNDSDVPILCIEGTKKYLRLLKKNVAAYPNVYICEAFLGKESKDIPIQLKIERGTAFFEKTTKNSTFSIRTLEEILEEFPDFKKSKVLKTDTDGFDTLILRGCSAYLKKYQPILFFEFDPSLINKNNDDPFSFIDYLYDCGYYWFIFYDNLGDFLLSVSPEHKEIILQVIHYFSGRHIKRYADVCAFPKNDLELWDEIVQKEIAFFKKFRQY